MQRKPQLRSSEIFRQATSNFGAEGLILQTEGAIEAWLRRKGCGQDALLSARTADRGRNLAYGMEADAEMLLPKQQRLSQV